MFLPKNEMECELMRFGLIGAGAIGAIRCSALQQSKLCELVAINDLDEGRAKAVAPNARFHAKSTSLFGDAEVDAVIISTPPHTHEELVTAALQAGKHVLLEKPMAPTIGACRRMTKIASETGKLLTVGYNHRYFEAAKLVRDAVHRAEIGKLTHVRAYAGHTGLSEFKAKWMYDFEVMGGGALVDNGTHVIDLLRYVMGDADEVVGMASSAVWNLPGVEDNGFGLLRSSQGVIGSIEASWSEWKGYRFYIEAYGDRGMARAYYAPMMATVIRMDKPGGKPDIVRNFFPRSIIREKFKGWQSTVIGTFDEELTDFVALALGKDAQDLRIARASDGMRAVEIAKAIYESSETGGTVKLSPLA
jgi:predicted dehydrogenase